jgi:hypothetical protein
MNKVFAPVILLLILTFAAATYATDPSYWQEPGDEIATPTVEAFYCQEPTPLYLVGASTGSNSELADDIPTEYAGQQIFQVTLYVSEWLAPWRDPQAVVVNFYNSACPPDLVPDLHYAIPWNEVEASLFYLQFPRTVYEVLVTLPTPVTIQSPMSIGSYLVIDWGNVQPYTGLAMTPETVFGCGEAYWDYFPDAPRWTAISVALGNNPADLAYCLTGGTTSVSESTPGMDYDATWGRIKQLYE